MTPGISGLMRLGDEGLQHVALDRQAQPGHRGDARRTAGDRHADLAGADRAARRLDAGDLPAVVAREAGDLAVLDDVDAALVGGARIAPDHRVVARGAAAALQQAALDRESAHCRN